MDEKMIVPFRYGGSLSYEVWDEASADRAASEFERIAAEIRDGAWKPERMSEVAQSITPRPALTCYAGGRDVEDHVDPSLEPPFHFMVNYGRAMCGSPLGGTNRGGGTHFSDTTCEACVRVAMQKIGDKILGPPPSPLEIKPGAEPLRHDSLGFGPSDDGRTFGRRSRNG